MDFIQKRNFLNEASSQSSHSHEWGLKTIHCCRSHINRGFHILKPLTDAPMDLTRSEQETDSQYFLLAFLPHITAGGPAEVFVSTTSVHRSSLSLSLSLSILNGECELPCNKFEDRAP